MEARARRWPARRRAAQRAFVNDARSSSLSSSSSPLSSRMAAHRFSSSLNFLTRLSAASRSRFRRVVAGGFFFFGAVSRRSDRSGRVVCARPRAGSGTSSGRRGAGNIYLLFSKILRRRSPGPSRSSPSRRCAFSLRPSRGRTWRGPRAGLLGLAPRRALMRRVVALGHIFFYFLCVRRASK